MRARLNIFQVFSAFVLGVVIAYGINPAVADITYQAASFLSSRVNALGTAINFYVSGTGIASIEAGGILPFTDGNNSISNLGASNRGYKNIYLSDGTNRSSLIQSNGLYIAGPSGQSILFRNGSTDVWSISSAGVLTQNATNGGDIVMNVADGTIRQGTSDAADSKRLIFGGGGSAAASRGAYAILGGNENGTSPGHIQLNTGNISGATADLVNNSSDGNVRLITGSGAVVALSASSAGNLTTVGTFVSSRTSDLGWTPVNAANQACNTTCTSACVFGMNTAALGNFVGCADATADTCICAGAS